MKNRPSSWVELNCIIDAISASDSERSPNKNSRCVSLAREISFFGLCPRCWLNFIFTVLWEYDVCSRRSSMRIAVPGAVLLIQRTSSAVSASSMARKSVDSRRCTASRAMRIFSPCLLSPVSCLLAGKLAGKLLGGAITDRLCGIRNAGQGW